jgi:heptosyltransferase I
VTSVLLVRLSAMGDLAHGLGVVQALHRARPDWRLTFVTQAPFAPLLEGVSGLARVVKFARHGGLREVRRLRADLRCDAYDIALDLQGNWKSAAVAWLSGSRERVGAAAAWRQEPRSQWLLHRTIEIPGPGHPALVALALARTLVPELSFAAPQLDPTSVELAAEREALRALGVDGGSPFRVIVVSDPADPRALRPAVIAAELAGSSQPTVLLVGPAEAAVALPSGALVLRHGHGEVRRLVALGALVARSGGEVLGPDQGASHVLAAAGAKTVVVFGAQDPRCTAPPAAHILVHPSPPSCSPCRQRRCSHPQGPVCMDFAVALGRNVPNEWPRG